MELDSIVYIVIAIILAIVNAVAQKRKKQQKAQQAATVQPSSFDQDEGAEADYVPMEPAPQRANPFGVEDYIKEFTQVFSDDNPDEYLDEDLIEQKSYGEEEQLQEVEATLSEPKISSLSAANKLNQEIQDSNAFVAEENIAQIFNYDDSDIKNEIIEQLEIGKASEKESILKGFTGKKAIIYSEIISPKYF